MKKDDVGCNECEPLMGELARSLNKIDSLSSEILFLRRSLSHMKDTIRRLNTEISLVEMTKDFDILTYTG